MVTGKTRFVPLLAHPIHHVRTPPLFNAECEQRELDMIMVPLNVRPDMLEQAINAFRAMDNVAGMVVTIPHKASIAELCDKKIGAANLVGACNIVRRESDGCLTGAMFDGEGFVAGLKHCDNDPVGRRTLLVGAGGAASGIGYALLNSGVDELTIANRSMEKAEKLADYLGSIFPRAKVGYAPPDPKGFDLIINGTALGMHFDDPLPINVDRLDSNSLVAEVVMQPDMTPLLVAAEKRGCRIHKGIHMIEQQVRLLVDFLQ